MNNLGICVIIPTYNNCGTLSAVIEDVLTYTKNIIVVNDGATDSTDMILNKYQSLVEIIAYKPNRGKGHALKTGFRRAAELGYRYAITIDSDGQHFPSDIYKFVEKINQHPDSMIVGTRFLEQENMPGKNTFANKFSNFWFTLQTGQKLGDTQSGFRLYPLRIVSKMKMFTNRYESELELLVRLAWRNVPIYQVPISVYYAPEGERISHFRPGRDFLRISLLNTLLTTLAIIYGYPSILIRKTLKLW